MAQALLLAQDPLNVAQLVVVALGLTGQYLVNLKNIRGYYAWITSNIVAIALMWHTGMYIMMLMYLAYIALCSHGVYLWRKDAAARAAPGTSD